MRPLFLLPRLVPRPPAPSGYSILPRGRRCSTSDSGRPIAAATGAGGNTTALVGTPEQVAESIVDYYDAGVTSILIRGFKPLEDAIDYGREVILVRAEVERRDRAAAKDSTSLASAAD